MTWPGTILWRVTGSEEARGILCSLSLDHQNTFVESRAQMRSMGGFGV